MHIKSSYSWLKHLDFMIVDLIAFVVSFSLAQLIKFGELRYIHDESWQKLLIVMLMLNVLITMFINPYSGILRRNSYQEVIRTLQLTFLNLMLSTIVVFSFKIAYYYSREVFFVTYALYFPLSLLFLFIWKKLLLSGGLVLSTTRQIPLFIISDILTANDTIKDVLAGDFQLYNIKGIHLVDDSRESMITETGGSFPVIDNYVDFILKNNIREVLIAVDPGRIPLQSVQTLSANGIVVNMVIEKLVGFQSEEQFVHNVGIYKSLGIGAFSFTPGQLIYFSVKRVFDILCGLVGLLILGPIAAVVKIAYLLSGDKARIFYRQRRVGLNGEPIRIWKFRSMIPNADEVLQKMLLEEHYRKEWEENQKFENDPRITKVGNILRKTSIDELPQLLNVLKGDMSLVGPRPLVEGELEAHEGLKLYQRVRPGITGWWGCNGRSNIHYRERLELEYYYVKNCSFYLDVLCIFRTVLTVLKKEGAK